MKGRQCDLVAATPGAQIAPLTGGGRTTGSEQHCLHGARRRRGKMAPCHAQDEQRARCAAPRRSGRAGSDL